MNNNIIKSLRRTLLNTVAAAVVSIGFTACADEIFETQNNTAPANTYKISIPASIGGGDTRAIAYNSQTGGYDATFEVSDFVFVYDVTKKAEGRKQSGGDWIATNLRPDENGKKVNLIGELAFAVYNSQTGKYSPVTPEIGDELMLFYNSTQNIYYNIQGNSIADYAIAKVKITSINDGVITTGPSSFQNPQSIYKINFTGLASTLKIKNVLIQSAQKKLVRSYKPVNLDDGPDFFGNVSYIYAAEGTDQHELTFMLRFSDNPNYPSTSGDEITFLALGSDGHNYKGTRNVSSNLINGKYYHADVSMTDAGLAMTLTNNTTTEVIYVSTWTQVSTKDAAYTASNTGYDAVLRWNGGENSLTLKDVSVYNGSDDCISAINESGASDAKVHNLVLDGVNTLSVTGAHSSMTVQNNCSLIISSTSTGTGKLILKAENGHALNVWDNGQLTIESGEVTVDGSLGIGDNSSCIITNSGKLRVLTKQLSDEGIRAAKGYVLNTTKEGDYTVYTVTAAPPYEEPKALSSVTTADLGKIIGSDRNVHMPQYDLPEGVRPVAIITNISSTGQGLALASDRIKYQDNESFTWNNSGQFNNGRTAFEIFQAWAQDNSEYGTWHLATKAEWQQMVINFSINGDATEVGDNMVAEGLVALLKQAGIFRQGFECWTAEYYEGKITSIMFDKWDWDPETQQSFKGPYKLRFNYKGTDILETNPCNLLPVLEFSAN